MNKYFSTQDGIRAGQQYPKTLKALNKYIQHEVRSTLLIVKGEGYYYIASDEPETALELAGLPQTGIYVYDISHLSFEGWYIAVKDLLSKTD